jgi:predicted AlkP superfamily pyrophosphatase or phosphodiesterase
MSDKLIVMMVDGVSADHYQTDRARLPFFSALEARGFRVERLRSEVLGTSLPGRTSMLTGVTADVSGVYANRIWDGESAFRYSTPDDVRVPTLPARVLAAGREAAAIGFGMIRPEDTTVFHAPWWSGVFLQRGRDPEPIPAPPAWVRVALHQPGDRFQAACAAVGVPDHLPQMDVTTDQGRAFFGFAADQRMADWVGAIAVQPGSPDLIMTEFLTPDTVQHNTGWRSPYSQWIVEQADLALGKIVQRLQAAGVADQWNIAVMSDHGHSAVETALFTRALLPGVVVQCEGGSLLVAPRDADELHRVTARLAEYGVEPYPNTCIPPEYREQVVVFVAPPGVSFEEGNPEDGQLTGKPTAISTHGLRPGAPGDDRFALFAGPGVPHGAIAVGDAVQVAPTLAMLLGLSLEVYPAQPLFPKVTG